VDLDAATRVAGTRPGLDHDRVTSAIGAAGYCAVLDGRSATSERHFQQALTFGSETTVEGSYI
jgi:hypothetical protein